MEEWRLAWTAQPTASLKSPLGLIGRGRSSLLHEVFDSVLSRIDELRSKAYAEWISYNEARERWIEHRFSRAEGEVKLCGVDGGRNFKEYRGFVIYVVNAEAVVYEGSKLEEPVKLYEVDILTPYRFVEERVRIYSEVLEAKAALEALELREVKVALIDGSLISSLIKPLYAERARWLQGIDEYRERLKGLVTLGRGIAAKLLLNELTQVYGSEAGRAASYLEGVEKLIVYRWLLERHRGKLIFISKTSRGVDYFKSFKPDIAIFEQATHKPGYSEPLHIKVGEKLRRSLPIDDAFFRSMDLTLFYARLEDGGPVLRFEVPGRLRHEEVEELLETIAPYSVAGYPYPLEKAHRDVEVEGTELDKVARIIGLYAEARGPLNH